MERRVVVGAELEVLGSGDCSLVGSGGCSLVGSEVVGWGDSSLVGSGGCSLVDSGLCAGASGAGGACDPPSSEPAGAELDGADVDGVVVPAGVGLLPRVITTAAISARTATTAPVRAMITAGCLYQGLGGSGPRPEESPEESPEKSPEKSLYMVGSCGGSRYDMSGA